MLNPVTWHHGALYLEIQMAAFQSWTYEPFAWATVSTHIYIIHIPVAFRVSVSSVRGA
uniref:Uncharacterized protein n=1 Tax=Anguilla anguilla TaxID=7936 RepID=A0A0E9W689_ANGAN